MTARSIIEALEAAASTPSGLTAIEHDSQTVERSYRQLLDDACRIGGSLREQGLRPGDRVGIVVPEISSFIQAILGISAAGLVPVPLCPPGQAVDLATFARQSRHVLVAARTAAVVTTEAVATILDLTGLSPAPMLLTRERLDEGPSLSSPIRVPLEATALLQFTSGSTASPKGVVLSHANIYANVSAINGPHGLQTGPTDVAVSWLPLYHDMGLIGMLFCAIHAAIPVVILSPTLFLKRPTAWLDAISRSRGTISYAPNFAYDLCRRRVKPSQVAALDLSSWRIAGCGAEPIRAESLKAFAEHFASTGFRASSFTPSYGLAEHSLAVTLSPSRIVVDVVDAQRLVEESLATPVVNGSRALRIVGCGRPFPNHVLKIVDDKFRELPERHVGAVVVSGPSVMEGYFEEPAATRHALRRGWLHTGDTGYVANGELFVCGRTKDLIVRQGRKYHPPDLESAITEVRDIPVSGVVVFGINRVNEADEIVAVLEARASARGVDLEDRVRRRIRETSGLELDRVIVTPPGTIPRTTSGKVRRAETRARLQAGTLLREVSAAASDR